MAIAFVQEWQDSPGSAASGTSKTATGAATAAGSTLLLRVMLRVDGGDGERTLTITDNGSNTWEEVVSFGDGEGEPQVFIFRAASAASITEVTVTIGSPSRPMAIRLSEFSGVGALVDTGTGATSSGSGSAPVVNSAAAGELVFAVGGVRSTSASWTVAGDDVTPTELQTFAGQQITLLGAYALTDAAEEVGIGWTGSPNGLFMANAVFAEGTPGPDPLTVDVGSDQSIYVGQTATVTATPDGGSESYTYAWTRVSGPAGSFLNSNQASTTFTPTGGAGVYVLRCIVNDGSTNAQDDLAVTVTAAPEFVTIASVADSSGWTATGGTVQAVLSDTSDSTLITSSENPNEQGLDVTFNNITLTAGQPLVLRMRARRADASSASVTAYLYDGSTLLSTSSATSVAGSFADINVTFPAADLDGISFPQAFRVVTEWTASA